MRILKSIAKNNKGATAIEYGLIAALIAVASMGAMTTVGERVSHTFTQVGEKLPQAK